MKTINKITLLTYPHIMECDTDEKQAMHDNNTETALAEMFNDLYDKNVIVWSHYTDMAHCHIPPQVQTIEFTDTEILDYLIDDYKNGIDIYKIDNTRYTVIAYGQSYAYENSYYMIVQVLNIETI